jgi:hypothetical protein
MGPCPSVLMWCFTNPVLPNSLVEDANIDFLSIKKFVNCILSLSSMFNGRLASKVTALDDSSRSAHVLIFSFSTRQISNVPINSYRGKEMGLLVSFTMAM